MKLGLLHLRSKDLGDRTLKVVPNGVGYLASYIEKYHPVDEIFVDIYTDELMKKKPDIVGISSVSETYPLAVKQAKAIKEAKPNTKIILGGSHITYWHKNLDPVFDVGVVSEGEEQFGEIIDLIKKDELNPDKLKDIKSIVFRDEQHNTIMTGKRDWIKDLDTIPPPNRKLLDNITLKQGDPKLTQYLITERGCPFTCEYCSSAAFWETVRNHSVERVMFEIEDIIRNFPEQKVIGISDDLFGLNKRRLKKIVEMIRSEGIHKKVAFSCQARASCFTEETVQLFRDMNIKLICFGFESANDRILKFLKGSGNAKLNQRAVDLCDKYGINIVGNLIIGSPSETESEIADSYWFMRRNLNKTYLPYAGVSTPFPGTKWWHYAEEMGLVDDSFDKWDTLFWYFDYEKTILMNKEMTRDHFAKVITSFYEVLETKSKISAETRPEKILYDDFLEKRMDFLSNQINETNINKDSLDILEINSFWLSLENKIPNANFEKSYVTDGIEDTFPEDKKFDYVFIPYTLETLKKPKQLLSKVKSLLKENGLLLINIYNAGSIENIMTLLNNTINDKKNYDINNHKNINFFTMKKLYYTLTKLGYKDITSERFKFVSQKDEKEIPLVLESFSNLTQNLEAFENELRTSSFFVTCKI